jgi:hypothetical protein
MQQMIRTRLQQQQPQQQQVEHHRHNHDNNNIGSDDPNAISSILRRIQVITCRTMDDLMDILFIPNGLISTSLFRRGGGGSTMTRIIVMDSIADLFRYDENNETIPSKFKSSSSSFWMERSTQLFMITQRLQQFIQQAQPAPLSILILNQVTSFDSTHTTTATNTTYPIEHPALGLSWSNCIHSRWHLQKHYHYSVVHRTSTSSSGNSNSNSNSNNPNQNNSHTSRHNDHNNPDTGTAVVTNEHPTPTTASNGMASSTSPPPPSPQQRILQRTLTVTHSTRYPILCTNFIITNSGCYHQSL